MSKRKLLGWWRTVSFPVGTTRRCRRFRGCGRRGFTPEAIRKFCEKIGISKNDSLIDMALLENCVRDDLNEKASPSWPSSGRCVW